MSIRKLRNCAEKNVVVYSGKHVEELSDSLSLFDKYIFHQKLRFRNCTEVKYSIRPLVTKVKDDKILFLISAHSDLERVFVDILRNIRYKRFLFFPIIFITSEKLEKLQILSQSDFEGKGFECAGCGWGSLHLKMPFTLQDLKEIIDFAMKIDQKKIRKGKEGLLHCQIKVIIK